MGGQSHKEKFKAWLSKRKEEYLARVTEQPSSNSCHAVMLNKVIAKVLHRNKCILLSYRMDNN
jgi:hypothetical protein